MNQRIDTERQPDVGRGDARADEVVRRDPDDGDGDAIEANVLPNTAGSPANRRCQ